MQPIIRAEGNQGWPDIAYGAQYDARPPDERKDVPVAKGLFSMPGVEEKLLTDREQRVRDVRQGPDGALYVLAGDSLLRLTPR